MTLKMNDSEETGKLVDSVYKNILDKFGPGARQLITAGKAYLKALHGASTAGKQYMEALTRLAQQAQQGTWGATNDIGLTLMQFAEVDREIHAQHLNILKAFYVDVLVPLETSLEKDTKVIQGEQKKFQQQFRTRQENYQKAVGVVKKQKKKTRTSRSSSNLEKELKNMQYLEDEKNKLHNFCDESLRQALTQERKRYGFVLERQCSLAKHYLAFYTKGENLLCNHLHEWQDISRTRDSLPEHIQVMFPPSDPSVVVVSNGLYDLQSRMNSAGIHDGPNHEDAISMTLRKAQSMDASSMDLRSLSEAIDPPDRIIPGPMTSTMTRAKSDFNLSSSHQSLAAEFLVDAPRSRKVSRDGSRRPLAKALYSYLSSGEHQLSFHEGDVLALIGERNKGWQYGENQRTRRSGWFPVAYVVLLGEEEDDHTPTRTLPTSTSWVQPSSATSRRNWGSASPSDVHSISPPPPPPPPMPPTAVPEHHPHSDAMSSPIYTPEGKRRMMHRSLTSPAPLRVPNTPAGRASTSLHSSNDSGFCNDTIPPPQPEVDYNDDDVLRNNVFATVKLRKTKTNDRSAPKIS